MTAFHVARHELTRNLSISFARNLPRNISVNCLCSNELRDRIASPAKLRGCALLRRRRLPHRQFRVGPRLTLATRGGNAQLSLALGLLERNAALRT
jgi:hypothetical protein